MSLPAEIETWIETLPDDSLRKVARMKWAGFTTREIARNLNRLPRAIERKLIVIQHHWRDHPPTSPNSSAMESR